MCQIGTKLIHFPQKIKILTPNIKYRRISWKNWTNCIIVKSKSLFLESALLLLDQFQANLPHVRHFCFNQITSKNVSLSSWEIIKKILHGKGLKFFHFSTLWIWNFGIFGKHPCRSAMRSKTQWVFYRGIYSRMAWTTKSIIRGNHWVPLGCRALLSSA